MEMELQEFVDPAVELRRDSLPEAEPNRGAQIGDHFGLGQGSFEGPWPGT
jgi:hypothetical protein